ncbi:MAG: flagellar brake protein [Solirubrobacteraceae bacterium]
MTEPAQTASAGSKPDNVRLLPGSGQGTLTTPSGEQIPVRTFDRGHEVVLVVLVDVDERAPGSPEEADLEYTSVRGVVRLHGQASFEERSLIRFRPSGDPEVMQRRSYVRVHTPQAVTLDLGGGSERRAHTVDLSGGGMLIAGADVLDAKQPVRFAIALEDEEPIRGVARVVRIGDGEKRALVFEQIGAQDRQRLIRYVFECMRRARARTRGDWV